jgi:hypothetical protein
VGDFDGDFVRTSPSPDRLQAADGVSVIFGATSGGPTAAVSIGQLGRRRHGPVSMVVADTLDVITDLFVVSASFPDRDSRAAAILFGSSSRRMLAPFSLNPVGGEGGGEADLPRAALIGEFSGPADGVRDIVAVAEGLGPVTSARPSRLWRVLGSDGAGGLDAGTAGYVDLPGVVEFDTGCSVWAAGDVDGDGVDEVVAIDHSLGRRHGMRRLGSSPAGACWWARSASRRACRCAAIDERPATCARCATGAGRPGRRWRRRRAGGLRHERAPHRGRVPRFRCRGLEPGRRARPGRDDDHRSGRGRATPMVAPTVACGAGDPGRSQAAGPLRRGGGCHGTPELLLELAERPRWRRQQGWRQDFAFTVGSGST